MYVGNAGTAPSIYLASGAAVESQGPPMIRGLVLQSPILSIYRAAYPSIKSTYAGDMFVTDVNMTKVRSPTLIVHGKADTMVPCTHGITLYEKSLWTVKPLLLEGAGHNNIETDYAKPLHECLRAFIGTTSLDMYDKQRLSSTTATQDSRPAPHAGFARASRASLTPKKQTSIPSTKVAPSRPVILSRRQSALIPANTDAKLPRGAYASHHRRSSSSTKIVDKMLMCGGQQRRKDFPLPHGIQKKERGPHGQKWTPRTQGAGPPPQGGSWLT
uniref:Peptidase S9 prolyl oligopeptidase catalytic domain-containing protein n=1 Tax=Lotharella globosa TaxID=91324 RepID=A0A7S3YLI2_9EUKA